MLPAQLPAKRRARTISPSPAQKEGREAVRRAGGIPVLVRLLQRAESTKARQRTVGALHNLSSEAEAVKELRMEGGIPVLAAMLQVRRLHTGAPA